VKQQLFIIRIEKAPLSDRQEMLFLEEWLRTVAEEERYEMATVIKNRIDYLRSRTKEER